MYTFSLFILHPTHLHTRAFTHSPVNLVFHSYSISQYIEALTVIETT